MNELNVISSSLPLLPSSLRSSFTSLPGGVRVVVRGYFRKIFDMVWPFHTSIHASSAPMSFIFLLPGVLSRLGFNITDVVVLSSVYFLSGGGKTGVLTSELIEVTNIKRPYSVIQSLQSAGYLSRNNFDPSGPYGDKAIKFIQHQYIFITAEGIQVLKDLNGAFRSSFYGVINRAAFGADNCNDQPMKFERTKKPGPIK